MKTRFWNSLLHRPPRRKFSVWQIELTTRCLLRCTMCCREGYHHMPRKDMALEDFQKIVPELHDVESVVLEGWGESLLHPQLPEIIRLVKNAGSRVGFVTSGKTLREAYIAELIQAGTDFIGFSLSGAEAGTHNSIRVNSDLPELMQNIRLLQERKARLHSDSPRIHIVYLLLKKNLGEVSALLDLAHNLGIHEVILIHMALVTNAWQEEQRIFGRKDTADAEKVFVEAKKKAGRLGIALRLPSLTAQDVAVCAENPLENLYISVNGNVSPCVYLRPPVTPPFRRIFYGTEYPTEKVGFGNIFQKPFREIWEDARYREFRVCFLRRQEVLEKMASAFWAPDKRSALRIDSLPELPPPCRTCYKGQGF
jgi:MoaA/NifB/PqqE/SkfB family radical SAM enzyme